jgi:oxygen-independent coproporphyrinogen-3 oxidase
VAEQKYIRRNIHTYPFKYKYMQADEFFATDKGSIYIHIPFCETKCHFCDYVVYVNTPQDARAAYVDALCKEISLFPQIHAFPGFTIDAIYVGGGTPGVLSAEQLIRILNTCRETFPDFTENCEVAVEFDPGCVDEEKLKQIRAAGFNRFSMGVQSFDEDILKENNRPHNLSEVYTAWEATKKSGFTHTNIDLIYPLIGLDMDTWVESVKEAIRLEPACITAYPLEVWKNTAYHHWLTRNKKQLPPAQAEVEMCRVALDLLEEAGYRRWSTTGYYHPERVDHYCRFLDYYWRTEPMIGFGVGSKSVVYNRCWANIRSMSEYIKRVESGEGVLDFATHMTKRQEMLRVMIRGLKVCEVSKKHFYDRFGVEMETIFSREINELVEGGFITNDSEKISLTREGQVFSSNVFEEFYTEDDLREPEDGEVQFGISDLVLRDSTQPPATLAP